MTLTMTFILEITNLDLVGTVFHKYIGLIKYFIWYLISKHLYKTHTIYMYWILFQVQINLYVIFISIEFPLPWQRVQTRQPMPWRFPAIRNSSVSFTTRCWAEMTLSAHMANRLPTASYWQQRDSATVLIQPRYWFDFIMWAASCKKGP